MASALRDPSISVKISAVMWLLPLVLLVLSCGAVPANFQSRYSAGLEDRNIKRIAIFPLDTFLGEEKTRVPFSPTISTNGKGGEKGAATLLSHQLHSAMTALPLWQIISDHEVRGVEPLIPKGSPEARARRLGQLVYADAVISGRIIRFREREGEAMGAQNPASVAFVLEMWDVRHGDVVWSGRFDETQRPLSENLLDLGAFARRGGRWLKAEELALEGVKKAVNELHQALYRKST